MMNVSKRLLSEVLGEEYSLNKFPDGYSINYKTTLVLSKYSGVEFINIYELAHKCKEWIKSTSHYELVIYDSNVYLTTCGLGGEGGFYYDYKFIADTEPEAVFAACQWVLDNKDK